MFSKRPSNGECQRSIRTGDSLNFLDRIDQSVDAALAIHLVLDNAYETHEHPEVKKWLAARPRLPRAPRRQFLTWLNQIEGWFAEDPRRNKSAAEHSVFAT